MFFNFPLLLFATINSSGQTGTTYYGDGAGIRGTFNSNFGNFAGNNLSGNVGSYNVNLGARSGQRMSGNYNTNVGYYAGYDITTGNGNCNLGANAGAKLTGNNNINIGYNSGNAMTTCSSNTVVGAYAGTTITTGEGNTFFGFNSGFNSNGTSNNNAFFGTQGGSFISLTRGGQNAVFGAYAGNKLGSSTSHNTLIGFSAGTFLTSGSENVAIGNSSGGAINVPSGLGLTVSSDNVLLGSHTMDEAKILSDGNVAIGAYAAYKYIQPNKKSVLVINNQAQMSNPILYGNFADNSDPANNTSTVTSQSQLAINTSTLKGGFSLTVNGPTFIGNFGTNGANDTKVNPSKFSNYYLWVERGIVSEDFAIASTNNWADYVFDSTYKLMSLSNLEAYIKLYNRLPKIPSANEVKQKGVSLVEMNTKLLAKVEELTLYVIQQDKKINRQRDLLIRLSNEMKGNKKDHLRKHKG